MSAPNFCRRCLLEEIGDTATFDSIQKYKQAIAPHGKAEESLYQKRLEQCKQCDELLNGTCNLCGCYVQMRAALKQSRCPASPAKW
ncbi:MAG: hypothetical protein GX786_02425 [Clostridiales bacterium]|nr:hypothetical protein [Clostridiales bacterium]